MSSSEVKSAQGLLQRVEDLIPFSPRKAKVQALTAHHVLEGKPLTSLALALALNALGEFDQAMEMFSKAAASLLQEGEELLAARCYVERAMAQSRLGQQGKALASLERARSLASHHASLQALCDRVEGRVRASQNRYPQALQLLERACKNCQTQLALVRCRREMGHVLVFTEPRQALELARELRHDCLMAGWKAEVAHCDYLLGLAQEALNRYRQALVSLQRARAFFAEEEMPFFASLCELDIGLVLWRLNRYREAVEACRRARRYFASRGIVTELARCHINMAVVYHSMNRYGRALALYRRAARLSLAEGRPLRAARCYENMALAYDHMGHYQKALALHQRAGDIFGQEGMDVLAALCRENLAGTYRSLGRYDEALEHYRWAREVFSRRQLPLYVARCDTYMAELLLAMGRMEEARPRLERALETCLQVGLPLHQAHVLRLLASVRNEEGRPAEAAELLARSRSAFQREGLTVDVALCHLVEGEMRLEWGEVEKAEKLFRQALKVLAPGFPDQAWRAQYGLGTCALLRGKREEALEHYLTAVKAAGKVRGELCLERLSSPLFARHSHIYDQAIRLAVETGEHEKALEIIEEGKARAFLNLLGREGVRLPPKGTKDPYLTRLLSQERRLRHRLESLRRKVAPEWQSSPLEAKRRKGQREILSALDHLSRAYEEVLEKLWLASSLTEDHIPWPFSWREFRRMAQGHLCPPWACLEYHLSEGHLTIIYADETKVTGLTRKLSPYDQTILRHCTSPEPDLRELVYRGTLHGHPVPRPPGPLYMDHLGRLLIPPEVDGLAEGSLLIIVPHGPLHRLPFQVLLTHGIPLVEKAALLYTPSLRALMRLWRQKRNSHPQNPLILGLEEFGERARPLSHVKSEVKALRGAFGERGRLLWGREASLEELRRLHRSGQLREHDLLHFATHVFLDGASPFQSRILLHDGELTVAEVLELDLEAELVVLSACESALGEMGSGDELVGLARAFFLAGARSLVAGLWKVEDASAASMMGLFYQAMAEGRRPVHALRKAQREMRRLGHPPYLWASFVVIGRP